MKTTIYTREWFIEQGKKGPKARKTNRVLTTEQSLAMIRARERKKRGKK